MEQSVYKLEATHGSHVIVCEVLLLIYWVRRRGVDLQVGKDPGTMVGWAGLSVVG